MATPHFEMPSGNDLKPNFLTNSPAGLSHILLYMEFKGDKGHAKLCAKNDHILDVCIYLHSVKIVNV